MKINNLYAINYYMLFTIIDMHICVVSVRLCVWCMKSIRDFTCRCLVSEGPSVCVCPSI